MTGGLRLKCVAMVGGSTLHKGEFVATGMNKSLSDLVRSTFSGTGWSPISTVGSNSAGVQRLLLRVLSSS